MLPNSFQMLSAIGQWSSRVEYVCEAARKSVFKEACLGLRAGSVCTGRLRVQLCRGLWLQIPTPASSPSGLMSTCTCHLQSGMICFSGSSHDPNPVHLLLLTAPQRQISDFELQTFRRSPAAAVGGAVADLNVWRSEWFHIEGICCG